MTDRIRLATVSVGTLAVFVSVGAIAQSGPKQVVKPPISQAWIDVATFSGFAMGGGMGQGMMNSTLGALMGGGSNAKAEFGYTQTGTAGRWMDVTLYTSRNANLQQALQNVPAATGEAVSVAFDTLTSGPTRHWISAATSVVGVTTRLPGVRFAT